MRARSKELVLLTLLLVVSLIFWLSLATLMPNLSWKLTPVLWSAFISVFLLLVVWGLVVTLVESTAVFIFGWALTVYMSLMWFLDPVFIAVASLTFIFGIVGYYRARAELQNTLRGGMVRPLRKTVPLVATMLAACVATGAYLKVPQASLEVEHVIPEAFFEKILSSVEPGLQKIDTSFKKDSTVFQYVIAKGGTEAAKLNDQQKKQVVEEQVTSAQAERGIAIRPDDRLSHVMYVMGTKFIKDQAAAYRTIFPLAFAVVLFVTLRLIAWPMYWLALAIIISTLRTFHTFGIIEQRAVPTTIVVYSFS